MEFCGHEGDVDPVTRHVTEFERIVAWFDDSLLSSFKTTKQVFLDLWLIFGSVESRRLFFVKEKEKEIKKVDRYRWSSHEF